MREILFRGKQVDNGEWVEGYYVCDTTEKNTYHYIFPENTCEGIEVVPETVEQFTGLTDKNGNKIFEDDIIKVLDCFGNEVIYLIDYKDAAFCANQKNANFQVYLSEFNTGRYSIEIIGNIYDNLELL